MRFTLRNQDGVFSVHVSAELTPQVRQVLDSSTEVCVIGRPKTFFHRQRRHLFLVQLTSCFAA